ncbi:MAG TPA: hypothetical protein VHK91_00085 [Flavisolibacter sp.]|nr:hypothetical protein [Flavisolibacter sp.]
MKRVVLVFPDTVTLTNYLLTCRVSGADVNSTEVSLTAILSDQQIQLACERFEAVVKLSYSVNR